MPASDSPHGLRALKKMQTRLAIRREAFRLFELQGYADTTIEQIAVAADVSPRTFYRYFGVKEAVLLSDDQISPIIDAFIAAPADLGFVEAYRHAVESVFGALPPAQREDAIAGQRLMYEIPEARGLLYTAYATLIDLITDALVHRPDAPEDLGERRVIAGAIVGVLMAASHETPLPAVELPRALSILAARLS